METIVNQLDRNLVSKIIDPCNPTAIIDFMSPERRVTLAKFIENCNPTPEDINDVMRSILHFAGCRVNGAPIPMPQPLTKNHDMPDTFLSRRLAQQLKRVFTERDYFLIIYSMLYFYVQNKAKAFDLRKKEEVISFTPANREPQTSGKYWSKKGRQTTKYGRIFAMLGIQFDNSKVERWINYLRTGQTVSNVRLLPPSEIKRVYRGHNYWRPEQGTLGNSCMRHDSAQDYLSIYEHACKGIAVIEYSGRIAARALVWKLTDGKIFMDRVYSCDNDHELQMLAFARAKKWYTKTSQDRHSLSIPDELIGMKVKVSPEYLKRLNHYPYADTLEYIYRDTKGRVYMGNDVSEDRDTVCYMQIKDTSGGFNISHRCAASGERIYPYEPVISTPQGLMKKEYAVKLYDGVWYSIEKAVKHGRKWYRRSENFHNLIRGARINVSRCPECGQMIVGNHCPFCAEIARANRQFIRNLRTQNA